MNITTKPSRRRRALPLAVLSTLGLTLAACGGGGDDATAGTNAPVTAAPTTNQQPADSTPADSAPSGSASEDSQAAVEPDVLAYSQCMRDNGIANFPDPTPEGGLSIDGETLGIAPDAPQFVAAQEACEHLMPPPDAGEIPEGAAEAMLAYAQCMRDEGITAFPDPADGGIALDGEAVGIDTPQFAAANEACKHNLPDGGAGGQTNEAPG